jgi:hypothetical protein
MESANTIVATFLQRSMISATNNIFVIGNTARDRSKTTGVVVAATPPLSHLPQHVTVHSFVDSFKGPTLLSSSCE